MLRELTTEADIVPESFAPFKNAKAIVGRTISGMRRSSSSLLPLFLELPLESLNFPAQLENLLHPGSVLLRERLLPGTVR